MKRLLTILCLVLLVSCSPPPPDGLDEWFHENGQLWKRQNYKNGERDGLYEEFYSNGQLRSRGNYIDGERDGLWRIFDEDGNLTRTLTYRNGVMVETNSNP